jgi:hypothetical protein
MAFPLDLPKILLDTSNKAAFFDRFKQAYRTKIHPKAPA